MGGDVAGVDWFTYGMSAEVTIYFYYIEIYSKTFLAHVSFGRRIREARMNKNTS